MIVDYKKDKKVFGYFAGWIDEEKRIARISFKSYPKIEDQELSEEEKEKAK